MTSSHPKPMFNWFLGITVFLTDLAWPGLQNWVNISTILIPDWAAITPPSCGTLRASSWTGQPSSAAWDGYSEKYHFDTHKHKIWYWCWLLLLQARGATFLSFFAKYSPTCIQLTRLVQGVRDLTLPDIHSQILPQMQLLYGFSRQTTASTAVTGWWENKFKGSPQKKKVWHFDKLSFF